MAPMEGPHMSPRRLNHSVFRRSFATGGYQTRVSKRSRMRKMGPLAADHPMVEERIQCPGCGKEFKEGEYVTLVAIGPGDDPEARSKARRGLNYNGTAHPAHWACVTGEEE
jgi:hypothetical protein